MACSEMQVPWWLRRRRDLSGNAKVLWAYLHYFAPPGYFCSIPRWLLADMVGMSKKQVSLCIRELLDVRLLEVWSRPGLVTNLRAVVPAGQEVLHVDPQLDLFSGRPDVAEPAAEDTSVRPRLRLVHGGRC